MLTCPSACRVPSLIAAAVADGWCCLHIWSHCSCVGPCSCFGTLYCCCQLLNCCCCCCCIRSADHIISSTIFDPDLQFVAAAASAAGAEQWAAQRGQMSTLQQGVLENGVGEVHAAPAAALVSASTVPNAMTAPPPEHNQDCTWCSNRCFGVMTWPWGPAVECQIAGTSGAIK